MSRRVDELLAEGAADQYSRLQSLKYAFLLETLRERGGPAAEIADRLDNALAPLSALPILDVVATGTPFFWLNVQRLLEPSKSPSELAEHRDHLLAQTFDSFFDRFEDGTEIVVGSEGGDLLMPRLGLRVPMNGSPVGLRRTGSGTVTVTRGGESSELDLSEPPDELRLPKLRIRGEPSELLRVSGDALFEPSFIDLLEPETAGMLELADMIGTSFEIIRQADEEVADQMRALISFYEPVHTPDRKTTHCSFSAPSLIGVIFVSEAYSVMKLAEAMVHEYHHNELYKLMAVDPLIDDRPGKLFYSPWRPDPRPMYGLLHAIHVYLGVLQYLRGGEAAPGLEEFHEAFRERRVIASCQVNLGLLQVDDDLLTETGLDVMSSIREEFAVHVDEIGGLPASLPPVLELHLSRWREENSELSDQVRLG